MTDYEALKQWLEDNAKILVGRTLEDRANMALLCDQSPSAVAQWKSGERFKEVI